MGIFGIARTTRSDWLGSSMAFHASSRNILRRAASASWPGDGALSYGVEKTLETYYKFQIYKNINGTGDYQYVINPAYNEARGPVSVLSLRLHWEF